MTTAQHFRGTAAEITKRLFPLPQPKEPGPKARDTPAWEKGYNSAITAIELQLAQIKD